MCLTAYRGGGISEALFPSYVMQTSRGLVFGEQLARQTVEDSYEQNSRIQAIHQLAVFALLLNESQLKGDHHVNKLLEHGLFLRFNDLTVNLFPPNHVSLQRKDLMPRIEHTGLNGGERMRFNSGANSATTTSLLSRCRKQAV